MLVSVVIRTLNEELHLEELLASLEAQELPNFNLEVVIVDSGSTDNTLAIAEKYGCRITHIEKKDFTFGRSLNVGCRFSKGEYILFLSGHCIPVDSNWAATIIRPLVQGVSSYVYGRQVGRDATKYSECQLFGKYYPEYSKVPQRGYFCNNANAGVARDAWERFGFNEELTGLEDMYLARKIVEDGGLVSYVAESEVYHIHDENWMQVKIRYEREAIALQKIMPELHFMLSDFLRCFIGGVLHDSGEAIKDKVFFKEISGIIMFRYMQYRGSYVGNHEHRKLSEKMKEHYFYPIKHSGGSSYGAENHSSIANEGK